MYCNYSAKDYTLEKLSVFTTNNLPKLKQSLMEHNNSVLCDFRRKFAPDMLKDFIGSVPRMAVGAAVFNYEALSEGHFEHIGP